MNELSYNKEGEFVNTFEGIELSHATMRSQDLIPCFMEFLKVHANDRYLMVIKEYNLIEDFFWPDDEHEFWDSEDSVYLLNETLFAHLNEIAPEGFSFGSHEGDGSSYGFWKYEDN